MDTRSVERDLARAAALIERANARLEPAELTTGAARSLMAACARIERLAGFGVAALSARVDDPSRVARVTGTSLLKARDTVATGAALRSSPVFNAALQQGEVSLDQAAEIARAEQAAPGCAQRLVQVAKKETFHVLKDEARKVRLEAEQHHDLAARQRGARRARTYSDPLGMVHIHMELEPHVGAPIVARAEATAQRLARSAKAARPGSAPEQFERHLADAYAALLSGAGARGAPNARSSWCS